MAILDWLKGLENRIDEPPPMKNFWSLNNHVIPEAPGVYILIARPGVQFMYPAGSSPVFYIGQSKNLRKRLESHLKYSKMTYENTPSVPYWPRYEYAAEFGGRYAILRTWQGMTPKDLEDSFMANFLLKYRSFPVTNGQGGWNRIKKVLREKQ